jgi:hypothetical protein
VIRCSDLRTHLGNRATIDTDILPIAHSVTLQAFLTSVGACQQGEWTTGPGEATDAVAKGVQPSETPSAVRSGTRQRGEGQHRFTGSSVGVFVPVQDLG